MKSRTTERFRTAFDGLPGKVQERARASYRLFAENPYHPSLRFKQVHPTRPIFSVRAGLAYRALGVRTGEEILWFWIGSHAEYDQLVSSF